MYSDYFGLQENPFSIAPDPRYLYLSDRHREALAHLVYGIGSAGGFVLLTGEVGTGKTTVCRCLLGQLPPNTQVACIVNPRLSVLELLATICDELGIPYPEGSAGSKVFLDRLNAFLLDSHAQGRQTVLIIDEAQNLSADVLEQVRLLTNLETNRRKLLQVIMLGQPELRRSLARPELRQLEQRITARCHLEPLSRRETAAYVRHRLEIAGARRRLIPPRLIGRIHRLSSGIPRRINILCDRALLGAYVQGREGVSGAILSQAARELSRDGGRRNFGVRLAAGTALFGLLALAFFLAGREKPPIATSIALDPGRQAIAVTSVPPPAPSPPPTPAPVPAFDWQTALPLGPSQDVAYQDLLSAWGLTYDPKMNGQACDFAARSGLACLYRRGSIGSLRQLDRPAVLTLIDDQRREKYQATMTFLGEETASFLLEGREVQVPIRELEKRWLGEFVLLWRKPPFERTIRPGDRGPEVDWLNRQVAAALGRTKPARGLPLKGEMLVRLKEFQAARGLNPDGLVGPNTLIHLDSALGGGSPRLAALQEDR